MPQGLADLVQELYAGTWCEVRADGSVSPSFEVKSGVRQGCVLSPLPFNCFMNKVLREAMARLGGGLHIDYTIGGGLFLTSGTKLHLPHACEMCCMRMTWR